jgi:epoxyqueuosine reductase
VLSAARLKALAEQAGFHRAGLARVEPIDPGPLDRWLARGQHADMDWLARRRDEHLDVRMLVASARTVLALAVGYGPGEPGPVARYARGRDYHYTLRDRLKRLRKSVLAEWPALPTYGSVDSNPVMEKVWAERAGLGFMGKHSLIIVPGYGARVMLATLILGAEADAYDAPMARQCGACTLCLQACPTGALPEPGVVDARRCLSFQTIENAGSVPLELRGAFSQGVFGCDLCQQVCPWNAARVARDDPGLAERPLARLSAQEFAALTPERYAELVPGSALARAGYHGLRRNALLALGAAREHAARELIERLTRDEEPTVAEAARWALEQLG